MFNHLGAYNDVEGRALEILKQTLVSAHYLESGLRAVLAGLLDSSFGQVDPDDVAAPGYKLRRRKAIAAADVENTRSGAEEIC